MADDLFGSSDDLDFGEGLFSSDELADLGIGGSNSHDLDSDFDIDSGSDISDEIGEIGDTSSDDFEETNSDAEQSKREVKKLGIKAILIGLAVIAAAFIVVMIANSIRLAVANNKNTANNPKPTQQVDTNTNSGQSGSSTSTPTSTDWKQFSVADGLTFNDEYVSTTFTVTSIQHYLKVVDSEKNIQVETRLTGALAGYIGTYEVEVPYSKGSLLSPGVHFDVSIQIGSTKDGKIVIGDIKY